MQLFAEDLNGVTGAGELLRVTSETPGLAEIVVGEIEEIPTLTDEFATMADIES